MIRKIVFLQLKNERLLEELTEKHQQAEHDREEAELARHEAEQANAAKSKFLAAASHDLRQPLHALTLSVLTLRGQIQGEAHQTVDTISLSLEALQSLFSSLLNISRLDAGVIQPDVYDVSLSTLFKRLANDYEPEAKEKGLTFHVEGENFAVKSDPQLLERILRNYLSNAIRYTERGGLWLRAREEKEGICIEVEDTGRGIPREKQREIYAEFHQLDNPERDRSKGLGLGLAIVERLSKLLHHPIGIDSEPGRGSIFRVLVPVGDAEAATLAEIELTDPDPIDLDGLLVLVLDDESTVRHSMGKLLEQWRCQCILASSEEEALVRLKSTDRPPDAIIADYRLREERTGAQAIRRIQRKYRLPIPALIVTGDTAPDRLREATESGYQLLHKPAHPTKVRVFLNKVRLGVLVNDGAIRESNSI